MRDVWYVLEDGRTVPPAEVAPGDDGWLVHESGVRVAKRPTGTPQSRGVEVDDVKEVKPEQPKRRYKTREVKAAE